MRGSRAWHRFRGPAPLGPPEPPACPANQRIGPPDFVGVGAQKAGTSWWNALIEAHPDVHRHGGQPKELHFFDVLWDRPWSAADATRYARYFPRPTGSVTGEWTPGYMIDFWTPGLIARAAPAARILVLLRDPLDRFRSGLTHTDDATARLALPPGRRGRLLARPLRAAAAPRVRRVPARAGAGPPVRGLPGGSRSASWRARSRSWACGPVDLPPSAFAREVNPTTGRKVELTPGLRSALQDGYAIDLEQLRTLVPELDLARWPTATAAGLA